MQDEQMRDLVERFLDGETTLEEEERLYAYFSTTEELDETLLPYAEYFRDLAALPSPRQDGRPRMRLLWTRRWVRAVAGLAAAVVLSLGGMWLYTQKQESRLAALYGGSYMIVDGKRCDDLLKIEGHIRRTLDEARQIELQADGGKVIDVAEREVLESVADPQERQRLREILQQ